jgi:hypothetical protein
VRGSRQRDRHRSRHELSKCIAPPPILLYMHKRLTDVHLCSQLLDSTVLRWPAVASAAPAVTRACRHGRLERCVLVPPPALAARCRILSRLLAAMCDPSVAPDCVAAAAAATRGFSGADLENVCRSAAVFASARGADAVSADDVSTVMLAFCMCVCVCV